MISRKQVKSCILCQDYKYKRAIICQECNGPTCETCVIKKYGKLIGFDRCSLCEDYYLYYSSIFLKYKSISEMVQLSNIYEHQSRFSYKTYQDINNYDTVVSYYDDNSILQRKILYRKKYKKGNRIYKCRYSIC